MMAGDKDNSLPPQLRFAWEGQDRPIAVQVPVEQA